MSSFFLPKTPLHCDIKTTGTHLGELLYKVAFLMTLSFAILLTMQFDGNSQSYTCPYGKQAVCLDYNDKVCDGFRGKCVEKDAACFDEFACGFKGFVCKSKLDEVVVDYNKCVEKNQELVGDYNILVKKANNSQTEISDLENELNSLKRKLISLEESKDKILYCITMSTTIEVAHQCP